MDFSSIITIFILQCRRQEQSELPVGLVRVRSHWINWHVVESIENGRIQPRECKEKRIKQGQR